MNWFLEVWKKYYLEVFKKRYAVFEGRARRKEFWLFILFNWIIYGPLLAIDWATGSFNEDLMMGVLSGIYSLAVGIPGLALMVRRFHDTERSAWWFFILLVPLIGPIWWIVLFALDGTSGKNKYGPDPKSATP